MLYKAVVVPKTLFGKHSLVPLYQNSILHPHILKASIHKFLGVDVFNYNSEHGSYSLWDFCFLFLFLVLFLLLFLFLFLFFPCFVLLGSSWGLLQGYSVL